MHPGGYGIYSSVRVYRAVYECERRCMCGYKRRGEAAAHLPACGHRSSVLVWVIRFPPTPEDRDASLVSHNTWERSARRSEEGRGGDRREAGERERQELPAKGIGNIRREGWRAMVEQERKKPAETDS